MWFSLTSAFNTFAFAAKTSSTIAWKSYAILLHFAQFFIPARTFCTWTNFKESYISPTPAPTHAHKNPHGKFHSLRLWKDTCRLAALIPNPSLAHPIQRPLTPFHGEKPDKCASSYWQLIFHGHALGPPTVWTEVEQKYLTWWQRNLL